MTPFVTLYSADIEAAMQTFFGSLREKDRRRYAAVEAAKLGPGGIPYLARLLGIDPNTIRHGLAELRDLPDLPPERVRQPGGGRKKKLDTVPHLADNFHAVLHDHTAGSPMNEALHWTDLTATDIATCLAERGTPVSVRVVEQLLDQEGYHRRQAQKALPLGAHPDRDAQFRNLARLKAEYLDSPNPVLSIDTKKRELLGPFYRDGVLLTRQTLLAFDHAFPRFADGVVIPYGLYDLRRNEGYVHLGTSHDTSAFACDCLEDWWRRFGREQYPQATTWLLLCDGGGSNSARTYLFKQDLQAVVNRLGLEVRVAHYPPYCSKYNPIEHRLFPHLTRACQGVLFTSAALVQQLMAKARTRTGLRVVVDVLDKVYETGRRVSAAAKRALHLVRDAFLPNWNYRLLPQTEHGSNPFGMEVI
jgi:hypothetical protein